MSDAEGTRVEVDARLTPRGPFRLLQPVLRRELAKFLASLPGWVATGLNAASSRPSVG
jgi:hypothetical protein